MHNFFLKKAESFVSYEAALENCWVIVDRLGPGTGQVLSWQKEKMSVFKALSGMTAAKKKTTQKMTKPFRFDLGLFMKLDNWKCQDAEFCLDFFFFFVIFCLYLQYNKHVTCSAQQTG